MEKKTRKSAVRESLVIEGVVLFSDINEANQFGKFGLTIQVTDAQKDIIKLKEKVKYAITEERKTLNTMQNSKFKDNELNLVDDIDKEGNETGLKRLRLNRDEKLGKPVIFSKDDQVIEGLKFIKQGTKVKVEVLTSSYIMPATKMIGLSLKLGKIKLLEELTTQNSLPKGFETAKESIELDISDEELEDVL